MNIATGAWVVVCDGGKALILENSGSPAAVKLDTKEVHEHANAPRTVNTTTQTETIEVITRDQRRRRWSSDPEVGRVAQEVRQRLERVRSTLVDRPAGSAQT